MKIGAAKVDFTPEIMGTAMLGYGVTHHVIEGYTTRVHARAYYMEDDNGKAVCMVVCELALIFNSLRHTVCRELKRVAPEIPINDANLLLMAQHTHSAPGGYSYHSLYNIATPGLQLYVLETYTNGIVKAIINAFNKKEKGQLKYAEDFVSPDKNVSFNRSINAYNQNSGVEKIAFKDRHLAVDRTMRILQFNTEQGKELGSLNWFAVHTTTIPVSEHNVHFDNKGYAARFLEKSKGGDYVAAFAHGYSGDVTGNFVKDFKRKNFRTHRGPYEDNDVNAQFNGNIQYEEASRILSQMKDGTDLEQGIDFYTAWVDMSNVEIDPAFVNGVINAKTCPSCIGVDMLIGAQMDGLGLPDFLIPMARSASRSIRMYEKRILSTLKSQEIKDKLNRKYEVQGNKYVTIETGENRLLGTSDIKNLVVPGFMDDTIKYLKYFHKKGTFDLLPMSAQKLPFQIFRIGEMLIVSYPFEFTTTTGRRIKSFIESKVDSSKIKHIVVSPYSNSYNGYMTTTEEYQVQAYEGGHNVFGQWSIGAIYQITNELLSEFEKPSDKRTTPMDVLSEYDNLDLEMLMYKGK